MCARPTNAANAKVLTCGPQRKFRYLNKHYHRLADGLCEYPLDVEQIKDCLPNLILADVRGRENENFITWAQELLSKQTGLSVEIKHLKTDSLSEVYQTMQELFGAKTFSKMHAHHSVPISWKDITEGQPDVIVVAPHNALLAQSMRRLPLLEASEGWQDIPAVQNGQVFVAAGLDLYRPGPRFLYGIAVLVSAMAGLDRPILKGQEHFYKVKHADTHRQKLHGH